MNKTIEKAVQDATPWQYERYLNTMDQLKEIELTEQEQLWILWLCSFDSDSLKPFISIVLSAAN